MKDSLTLAMATSRDQSFRTNSTTITGMNYSYKHNDVLTYCRYAVIILYVRDVTASYHGGASAGVGICPASLLTCVAEFCLWRKHSVLTMWRACNRQELE